MSTIPTMSTIEGLMYLFIQILLDQHHAAQDKPLQWNFYNWWENIRLWPTPPYSGTNESLFWAKRLNIFIVIRTSYQQTVNDFNIFYNKIKLLPEIGSVQNLPAFSRIKLLPEIGSVWLPPASSWIKLLLYSSNSFNVRLYQVQL